MLMQEMEGCGIGEDPDVDGVPTDSVETEVNVFVECAKCCIQL